jgi:predicted dehydrogenase
VARTLDVPDVHDDWQALIESDRVDIVSVVTPPHLHRVIVEAALRAGKHVICEKPTALNVAEAEAMLAAAQAAPDCMAIIDHELRFNPPRVRLRELVRDGYVGSVLALRIEDVGGRRLDPTLPWSWWSDAERGGGMLGAVGSHMFDLARWMLGRVNSLTAQLRIGHYYRPDPATGQERQVTADDHAHLLLHFANNVLGTITVSGITPGQRDVRVEVYGTEGGLRIDSADRLWGLRGSTFPGGDWQQIDVEDPVMAMDALPDHGPFARGSVYLAQAIAASLAQGEIQVPEAASFYDGLVVQRALDAARRSHDERTWVQL